MTEEPNDSHLPVMMQALYGLPTLRHLTYGSGRRIGSVGECFTKMRTASVSTRSLSAAGMEEAGMVSSLESKKTSKQNYKRDTECRTFTKAWLHMP